MNHEYALIPRNNKGQPRPVKLFPRTSSQTPAPWPAGYARVMIPFTKEELRTAHPGKTHHIQVVRISRLKAV